MLHLCLISALRSISFFCGGIGGRNTCRLQAVYMQVVSTTTTGYGGYSTFACGVGGSIDIRPACVKKRDKSVDPRVPEHTQCACILYMPSWSIHTIQ